ncbi:MAG: PBP1A family penicillin-binding protein, partial [Acidobacteriota bacterium]|nr:PBP1A family penicillin-binding protein [Acidobacteriota bacterium]MDQ5873104.1 PBP1A family penicillin-binding protein [Acidobacteriota bacterium]
MNRGKILFALAPLVAATLLGAVAGAAATNFIRVPRVSELETYRPDIITEIRGTDGSTIARYAIERRILVSRGQIPVVLRNAIIATEDKNFFRHGGIDVQRTASALLANVKQKSFAQGGSTLTQQLARAIFLSPKKTISRKINEAFVAFEIERRYSKEQILTMYANEIYFGHGNYGVEAASRYYFGKSIEDLTLAEAALLGGIVQRPEDQSPFRSTAAARRRRGVALARMRAEGYITEEERRAADGEPLPTAPSLEEAIVGPYFSEEIRRYLERTYGEQELYRRGLRIESTLDPEFQRWSEEALGWGLRRLARRHSFRPPRNLLAEGYTDLDAFVDPSWEGAVGAASARGVVLSASRSGAEIRVGKKVLPLPASGFAWTGATDASRILHRGDLVAVTVDRKKDGAETVSLEQDPKEEGAVLVIENASGAVRAMVGGYDWTRSKFNRSTQALRQAGSTFKPFVYLAALEAGYTPSDTVFDGPISIVFDPHQPPYRPHNYDNRFRGIVTMRRALEYSYNVSAVRVSELVGRSHVIEAAHRLGIRQKLSPYPSVALGAFEVTLAEMTSAFSVFANQGLAFPMYLFDRITDANGDLLEQTHPDAREVVSPTACFQLLQMMKGVTQRGTAASAARLKLNIAGKTGTTNDFTDAWFIGMTPRYTIGVWVGNDRKNAGLGRGMDGARAALPIWIRIVEKMKEAGRIDPKEDFEAPPNVVFTAVDYETGLKATRESPRPILETFVSGSQPTEEWSSRWEEITRLPWSLQRSFYLPKKGEGTEDVPAPPATPVAASPAPAPTP